MTDGRSILVLVAGSAAAVGVLVGYWFAPHPTPSADVARIATTQAPREGEMPESSVQTPIGPSAADYAALEQALEKERALRSKLQDKLDELLAAQRERPKKAAAEPGISTSVAQVESKPTGENGQPGTPEQEPPDNWFDREGLVEAGLSESEIREIEERWEEHEMQKLYLTDKATREGTLRTKEYFAQMAKLERAVLADLGTEAYDAYLFATGKPNRVLLKQVLESSPAGYAGLQADDIVIRYGGDRIFQPFELKTATNRGEAGTATSIEVLRDDRVLQFSVPRGPLGVQLNPLLLPPDKSL